MASVCACLMIGFHLNIDTLTAEYLTTEKMIHNLIQLLLHKVFWYLNMPYKQIWWNYHEGQNLTSVNPIWIILLVFDIPGFELVRNNFLDFMTYRKFILTIVFFIKSKQAINFLAEIGRVVMV